MDEIISKSAEKHVLEDDVFFFSPENAQQRIFLGAGILNVLILIYIYIFLYIETIEGCYA